MLSAEGPTVIILLVPPLTVREIGETGRNCDVPPPQPIGPQREPCMPRDKQSDGSAEVTGEAGL
jgi:hypothetical protein